MYNNFLINSRSFFQSLLIVALFLPVVVKSQNTGAVSEWLESYRKNADFQPVQLLFPIQGDPALLQVVENAMYYRCEADVLNDLLHQAPVTMTFLIPRKDAAPLALELAKVEILAPNFSVGTKGDDPHILVPNHTGAHYRGIVRGNPNSIAAFSHTCRYRAFPMY